MPTRKVDRWIDTAKVSTTHQPFFVVKRVTLPQAMWMLAEERLPPSHAVNKKKDFPY